MLLSLSIDRGSKVKLIIYFDDVLMSVVIPNCRKMPVPFLYVISLLMDRLSWATS